MYLERRESAVFDSANRDGKRKNKEKISIYEIP